jgi:hypothetical protein
MTAPNPSASAVTVPNTFVIRSGPNGFDRSVHAGAASAAVPRPTLGVRRLN